MILRRVIAIILVGVTMVCNARVDSDSLYRHARRLHNEYISLDSHTDAPLEWAAKDYHLAGKHPNCVTLDKMDAGALDAQYLAAYVASDYRTRGGRRVYPLDSATFANRRAEVIRLLNIAQREIDANPGRCGLARTAADVQRLKSEGRHAFLLGVENGICIGRDIDFVDTLATRGVTYITLTHVYDNQLCTSSSKTRNRRAGLTPTGRAVVERMNALGVIIDLSHCSERTFYDVIEMTTRPVVCSHSGVKAIRNHDRNLTDDQLRAIARNGGVIQIVAYRGFVGRGRNTDVSRMVDHIDHAVRIAGIDHVGIGTDFDGGGHLVGLRDDADFINITVELIRRGYKDEDIGKILGANFLRVLQAQK